MVLIDFSTFSFNDFFPVEGKKLMSQILLVATVSGTLVGACTCDLFAMSVFTRLDKSD